MTEQTLRAIIEEASCQLQTCKHPNVWECQERLNEIIVAAKLGGISHDNLVCVDISRGTVTVRTTYSVRCCEQEGLFEFPEHIIDAEDPIKAATIWGLEIRLSAEREKLEEARQHVKLYEKRVKAVEAELMTTSN